MCFIIPLGERFEICQSILYIGGVVRETRCAFPTSLKRFSGVYIHT